MSTNEIVQWHNCYDDSWKDLITPESFSHPAKYSRGLIQRIYQYCLEKQYFTEGMTIIDPFGGIGLGAIATHYGLNWLGNELEPRFCQIAWSWDCPGIKQEDYDGYKGQCESPQDWYKLDLGICSECVYKAIEGEQPQPGLFEQVGYFTNPHRYHGNLERFKRYAQDGTWAKLTQGDSRKLNEIWAEGLVSSPPFTTMSSTDTKFIHQHLRDIKRNPNNPGQTSLTGDYGSTDGQLANMSEGLVSSPPFAGNTGGKGKASREGIDAALFDRHSGGMVGGMHGTEGNLESLEPGKFEGLVSSPPFASSVGSDDSQKRGGILKSDPKRRGDKNLTGDYGDSEGQLSKMAGGLVSSPPFAKHGAQNQGNQQRGGGKRLGEPGDSYETDTEGQLSTMGEGLVSSPPYAESVHKGQGGTGATSKHNVKKWDTWQKDDPGVEGYGTTPNNIGNDSGPTFWQAASDIVRQCHSLLAPGSYCVWITKNYIKNGKEVDFTSNWQQLCISCGFEMVEEIRAMLVKNLGTQTSHSGDDHEIIIERKSFFRRLFEANARATEHWKTLSKQDQCNLIMLSYTQLLLEYLDKLSRKEDDVASIIVPAISRTISGARMIGWIRDGKIRYAIDTAIDYETVTIMRKV